MMTFTLRTAVVVGAVGVVALMSAAGVSLAQEVGGRRTGRQRHLSRRGIRPSRDVPPAGAGGEDRDGVG